MKLIDKIKQKKAKVGIIGLGYVGLPLVIEFCQAGFAVTGFDVDEKKVNLLSKGKSYIKHIDSKKISACLDSFMATNDFSNLAKMDCIIICVPTPLNSTREPDMSYVFNTADFIAKYLKPGQLIILESTTYPGTTDEDLRGVFERGGLKAGKDFNLAFSPEREDPNNKSFSTRTIPKVVGGYSQKCLAVAKELYDAIVEQTVPVSSTKAAEATKLLENIYRAVNIALVNELKILFDRMGIDIFEVINAAKTKPFGFQAFYPGPGLGGHCIPIDPFYLTWKARQYDFSTRFIELAGEINTNMPYYVVDKTIAALSERGKAIKGAKILILGVAYKKDIDDQRESPSLKIIEILKQKGANVSYYDPYVPICSGHRHYPQIDLKSRSLTKQNIKKADAVLILTDHSEVDYKQVVSAAKLVVDTRNVIKITKALKRKVVKA